MRVPSASALMSAVIGAPASLALALGFHDLMNGTATNPAPTAPTTAVVAVRNRRRPWFSTPSLPIRHAAKYFESQAWAAAAPGKGGGAAKTVKCSGTLNPRTMIRCTAVPCSAQSAGGEAATVALGEDANPLDVALGLAVGRNAAVLVDRAFAGVVAGGRHCDVAVEALEQPGEILDAPADVLHRVEGIGDPEASSGRRHELHQNLGADPRERVRVERRLGVDDGPHHRLLDAVVASGLGDFGLVGGGVEAEGIEIDPGTLGAGVTGFHVAVADRAQAADAVAMPRRPAGVVAHAVLDVGVDLAGDQMAR